MKQVISYEEMDHTRDGDDYPGLLNAIQRNFDDIFLLRASEPLFTTDAHGLYDLFLDNLPVEARQHYNCRACRTFVERYGGIARIDSDTFKVSPILWGNVPEFFEKAARAIQEHIACSKITGVFLADKCVLGVPYTGAWEHMCLKIPASKVFCHSLQNASQKAAEKRSDFQTLSGYVMKYDRRKLENAVRTSITYLSSPQFYRGDKFIGQAMWLQDMLNDLSFHSNWKNVIWYYTAAGSEADCHISTSVLASMIDDIYNGYDIDAVRSRFNAKMDPLQYQRPQAAPAAGNVARAEEIVKKLGIEASLKRRLARTEELKTLWKPAESKKKTSGVFGDVITKEKRKAASQADSAYVDTPTTITWEKFRRKVLPGALQIEYFVPRERKSYTVIVTAADRNAPPIIKWDSEGNRNSFSWYLYSGGSYPDEFGLQKNSYVKVKAVTLQPNLWNDEKVDYGNGRGVLFVLDGAHDYRYRNAGSALFPEILREELRPVRATIEAYSKKTPLEGSYLDAACGIHCQEGVEFNAKFRVTTKNGVSVYMIDRWD